MTMMRKIAILVLFVFVSLSAGADICAPLTAIVYSDQGFQVRILFDDAPAKSVKVRLYSGEKVVHSFVTDHDGALRSDPIPEGTYQFVICGKGTFELIVRAEKSGLHGPFITWVLFPKSNFHWVEGKNVKGRACPIMAIKD